jgi:hypothetical protein
MSFILSCSTEPKLYLAKFPSGNFWFASQEYQAHKFETETQADFARQQRFFPKQWEITEVTK